MANDEIGKSIWRLGVEDGEFRSGIDGAKDRVRGLADEMQSVGRRLTTRVTLPLGIIGGVALKTSAQFDQGLRTMAAVSGVAGERLESMRQLAIKMGQATVFSAQDSLDAMLALTKAGITPAEIEMGALKNTMDLAAAADVDLAQASTILGSAMNTFSLSGQESQRIVDALAGAANESSADIQDLAFALQMGGGSAAAMGISVEETAGALALLADNGIRGSDAGTLLRSQLRTIVPTTDKAREMMKELGLEFFDSQGTFIGLAAAAQEMQNELGGMSQKQRMATISVLFGSDAMRLANVLVREGAAGIEGYTAAASEQGAASRVAAARMGGLSGSFEQFRGSVETALLVIGDILTPVAKVILGIGTAVVNAFTAMPAPIQGVFVAFGVLVGAIGPLLIALGALIKLFIFVAGPFKIAILLLDGLAVALGGLGFQTAAGGVLSLSDKLNLLNKKIIALKWAGIRQGVLALASAIAGPLIKAVRSFWLTFTTMSRAAMIASGIGILLLMVGIVVNNWETIERWFRTFFGWLSGAWDTLWNGMKAVFGDVVGFILDGAEWIANAILGAVGEILEFAAKVTRVIPGVGKKMAELAESFQKYQRTVSTELRTTSDRFHGWGETLTDTGERAMRKYIDGAQGAALASQQLGNKVQAAGQKVKDTGRKLTVLEKRTGQFFEKRGEFIEWKNDITANLTNVGGVMGDLAQKSKLTADKVIAGFKRQTASLKNFSANLRKLRDDKIPQAFLDQLLDMGLEGAQLLQVVAGAGKKTRQQIYESFRDMERAGQGWANALKRDTDKGKRDIEIVRDVINKTRDDAKAPITITFDVVGAERLRTAAEFARTLGNLRGATFETGGGLPPHIGAGFGVVQVGQALQQRGFAVGEHPSFGGVDPVHAVGSYHYTGRAIDVNFPGPNEVPLLNQLGSYLRSALGSRIAELFYPANDPVGGHQGHLHLAMQRGGLFRRTTLLAENSRSRPEAVVPLRSPIATDLFAAAFARAGGGGGREVHLHVTSRDFDTSEAVHELYWQAKVRPW